MIWENMEDYNVIKVNFLGNTGLTNFSRKYPRYF